MKTITQVVQSLALRASALSMGLVMLGAMFVPAQAQVTRTGPNGNTAVTERSAQDGVLYRSTTGPNGNSATTTTTAEDGTIYRTVTGPEGNSATSTHDVTVQDGQITRESTGYGGNTRIIQRSR
jgi:hypothetical protein